MDGRDAPDAVTRTARAQWKGDLRAEIRTRGCPAFASDEPKERGGLFEHPTPAEYLLGALAGCAAAHVEMFARRVGMPLEDCRSEGRLTMARFAAGDPRGANGGVTGVELDIHVISTGSEEQLERVKALFRRGCVLRLFVSAAAPVRDEWLLSRP